MAASTDFATQLPSPYEKEYDFWVIVLKKGVPSSSLAIVITAFETMRSAAAIALPAPMPRPPMSTSLCMSMTMTRSANRVAASASLSATGRRSVSKAKGMVTAATKFAPASLAHWERAYTMPKPAPPPRVATAMTFPNPEMREDISARMLRAPE
ncbi:hypothetical protein PAA26_00110 [Methanomassiliicoccaceae archaeon COG_1]|nr:hypothetical protein [Methanomassiliicoccaceae archaeon COG_1]